MDEKFLSHLAKMLVSVFEQETPANHEKKITVNPVVSKFATWYEKLRNAMEYHEEEVILRAAIERILKRRLLLGGNAKTTAEPLVRELMWAGYLPSGSVTEKTIRHVEDSIDFFLHLRIKVLQKTKLSDSIMNEWTYHLISSDVEHIIKPNIEKDAISSIMYQILKEQITIIDDTQETKNAQVFIAIRRAFARDDVGFLRYHLFRQFFGELTHERLDTIVSEFPNGYKEIEKELNYPRKEKIYSYIRKRSAAFLILEDVLRAHKGKIEELLKNKEELEKEVMSACEARYKSIASRVQRAIIRSVAFILLTKVIFAFSIEGTYERIFYGRVLWQSILVNTGIPPILMLIIGLFMKTPDTNNSKRILSYIETILYQENPKLDDPLEVALRNDTDDSGQSTLFTILWFLAFIVSFGGIMFVLTKLHFNIVSQGIFIFFLAIVSFLSYRISLLARTYRVGDKHSMLTPIIDFLFMPVVRVGRHLTEGISQVNFLLFLFDMIIETPFKVLFGFFEQWFGFLQAKREELE